MHTIYDDSPKANRMFKNHARIAWRNLLKHKSFSFINIAGLAIGLAGCMIIFLYVRNELTFDRYNTKADRIARVTTNVKAPESDFSLATTPTPLADALKRDYPEVESVVRLENAPQSMKINNEPFREDAFYKADASVFSIFDFHFIEGWSKDALSNPGSIVITETIAKKYFGTATALGRTMICNGQSISVTGVVKDRPTNSDIKIDALLSTTDFSKAVSWMDDFPLYTFVLFTQKPDLKNFEKKLTALSAKYVQPELNAQGAPNYRVKFELQSLSEVHFGRGKLVDTPKGNKQFSYIFSLLALFILIIALLNYINLATAKSTERAKEVGIRKVSGAFRFQLISQFLFESFFLIMIAWLLALVLVQTGLPFFNKLLRSNLAVNWAQSILFIVSIFIVTFLLAGLYPAFILSSFTPVKVLKGNWRHSAKGILLRKTITITQFAIAAALILGTTVVYKQMRFIQKKDLGFNKSQLMNVYLPRDSALQPSVNAFQNELRQRPEINGLTIGNGMTEDGLTIGTTIVQSEGKKRELMCNYYGIDPHFLPVFQVHLAEGRNLSDSFGTDKKEAFLVNQALVKMMGWKSAIGQEIEGFGHKGKVVGVVKNFYYRSLHNIVEPLVLVYNLNPANTTTVRIKPSDLHVVTTIFRKYFPSIPADYAFFDEIVDKRYEKDKLTMSLFNDFTILAIFVSCLGLYGLVSLIAVQRTKEIGIRKVMGATLSQLLSLMAKDFMELVLWALVIALPVGGYFMNKWLASYAYHILLTWWIFLIPVFLVTIIALMVISREIVRAAVANPVRSLRTE